MSDTLYDAIVVGGGISGIVSAIRLEHNLGLKRILIVERASRFGGTWEANSYPGCGCDVPTKLYSLSFEQKKKWDQFFSSQSEISAYLRGVADKYRLSEKTLFQHEAQSATFDEQTGLWQVALQGSVAGEASPLKVYKCRVLVSGMGALSVPRECNIKGAETFKGPLFHSARWDHSVDFEDKNVVILGNGCSASQIIPRIVTKVKQLTQVVSGYYKKTEVRSKHWVSPQIRDPFVPFRMLEVIPGFTRIERFGVAMFLESHFLQADKKWGKGARDRYAAICRRYVEQSAPKEYHSMLIPSPDEVQVACKRRIFDDGYIPALCRKNMELTNDQVVEIKPESVVLASGREVPCDILVHANGFKSETFSLQMDIVGPSGSLADYWNAKKGPQAYRGTMIANFPNFFVIWGPNTVTGHFSAIWTIESCVDLMISSLRPCFASGARPDATVQVAEEAQDKEQEYIQFKMKDKIYTTGCGAWYTDAETGRVTALAPCTQTTWQRRCRYPVMADFQYKGTASGKSAASYLPLRKQLGVAMNRGSLPDYQNQSTLQKQARSLGHGIAMTSYQAASWTFDTLFGWDFPEPYNRK